MRVEIGRALERALEDRPLGRGDGYALIRASGAELPAVLEAARTLRDRGKGRTVTFSKKIFLPLTTLCRDDCGYCTFRRDPGEPGAHTMTAEEVLALCRAGARLGCKEALFSLGDKPEARFPDYRAWLRRQGFRTTLAYLRAVAARVVVEETPLLPHLNPGLMAGRDLAALKEVSVSMGLMLESASDRLLGPGGPHDGAPDKVPAKRLRTLEEAGRLGIPFTTGVLIGIGETPEERVDALLAIREVHARWGHIQEVIVQNFRAKPTIPMAKHPEPGLDDLLRTIATARLVLGHAMNLQAPPNLSPATYPLLLGAGLNDWGGISPLTIDHINPEAPWPEIVALARATARAGGRLRERLAIYPEFIGRDGALAAPLRARVAGYVDAEGLVRPELERWRGSLDEAADPGLAPIGASRAGAPRPRARASSRRESPVELATILDGIDPGARCVLARALDGEEVSVADGLVLAEASGRELQAMVLAADELRRRQVGDVVTYVVNRNINFTNVCIKHCTFCAFSRDHREEEGYLLPLDEIVRRAREAVELGATEVCIQAGLPPKLDGWFYETLLARRPRRAGGGSPHKARTGGQAS